MQDQMASKEFGWVEKFGELPNKDMFVPPGKSAKFWEITCEFLWQSLGRNQVARKLRSNAGKSSFVMFHHILDKDKDMILLSILVSGSPNRFLVIYNHPIGNIYHLYTTYVDALATLFWSNTVLRFYHGNHTLLLSMPVVERLGSWDQS